MRADPEHDVVRRPTPGRLLRDELDFLRATADRSDPLDETVLCLFEAAVQAATAAERARAGGGTEAALREMLAATRAAVVAATFAVVAERDTGRERARIPVRDTRSA